MKHTIQNDVYTELVAGITSGTTTINVAKAVSPYRDVPAPEAGKELHLTIVDSMAETTAIEIVNVTQRTDAGGSWELTVERAREGTTAQAFSSGAPTFLAITKASYDAKVDEDDLGTAAMQNSTAFASSAQGSRADTAHGWGDHSLAGYVETETDPTVAAHIKAITDTQIGNWDVAYSWGDHSGAGYAINGTGSTQVRNNSQLDGRYLQSETDPTVPGHVKSILSTDITNWDTAYGWGNHASAGYLVGPFNDTMHGDRGGGTLHDVATTTVAGFMSGADKTKLNGIAAGAQVNVGTNLSQGGSGNSRTINSSTGSNVTVSVATTTNAGFMSTGDKSKLNGIEAGAEVNTVDSVNGKTGTVTVTKADVGLGSVDNVSASSLRSRSTHTGTQAISTVSGLQAELDSKVDKNSSYALVTPSAGTATINLSTSQNFTVSMNQNATLDFTNISSNVGQSGLLIINQDATGGRTFTLPAACKTPVGGAAIVQSTAASTKSILNYVVVSSTEIFVNYIGDFQ